MMGRGVVSVGVLAHSPFFAAHSPGKLLMMFLTQQLAREGVAALDLTPGGDQWKERFADRHEVVRKLTISSTGVAGAPRRVAEGTLALAGKTLRAVGVSPSRVRALVNSAEESGIPNVLKVAWRQAISGAYYRSEIRAYRLPLQNVPANPSQHIKRDALEDLALFRRAKGSSARAAFFKNVLMRLELGHHIYTRTEGGRLVAWSWFVERPERVVMEEVHQEFVYPPNSGEIGAFFTEPDVRGRGYSRQCVEQMIRDAAHAGLERLYAFVPGHNRACCHLLEQSGFSPVARLFERRFLGRSETGHSFTDATAGRIGPVQEKDVSSGDRVPEAPRPDR
jgi:RimJ/RimL family protein N-acetyltransferase